MLRDGLHLIGGYQALAGGKDKANSIRSRRNRCLSISQRRGTAKFNPCAHRLICQTEERVRWLTGLCHANGERKKLRASTSRRHAAVAEAVDRDPRRA